MRRISSNLLQQIQRCWPCHFSQTLASGSPPVPAHSKLTSPNTVLVSSEPVPCCFCIGSRPHSWPLFCSTLGPFMQLPVVKFHKESAENVPAISEGKMCWSCGSDAPPGAFLLCPACNTVQPLDPSVDYFELFNMEQRYDLNLRELEQRYKALQKKLHPDLFGLKSELHVRGVSVEEEGTVEDLDILMEIMEMQEAVEATSDAMELQSLLNKARSKISECEKCLVVSFKENNLSGAKTAQQEMSYYDRVCNTILKKL